MRHNFRINRGFPNPPRNYLRVLRAKIKNQNSFGAILGGTGTLCLQEYYFTDSTKIVKRDHSSCSQNYLITANQFLPPADGTLSLASLRLPRPCRGSRGFGPPKTHPRPNRISPPACGLLSLASLRSRGFEPPWVAPLPPQGSASASFATSAYQKS